ncbi:hypothetical protein ABTE85_20465, partial [Acinetobacter baumannii]
FHETYELLVRDEKITLNSVLANRGHSRLFLPHKQAIAPLRQEGIPCKIPRALLAGANVTVVYLAQSFSSC